MHRIKTILLSVLFAAPLVLAVTAPTYAAIDPNSPAGQACTGTGGKIDNGNCVGGGGSTTDLNGSFKRIADVLIFLVGAISVIMVIIGGLRYVLSGGDSAGVKSAKDTILYAIVGVVVALLAYALVHFVISRFA